MIANTRDALDQMDRETRTLLVFETIAVVGASAIFLASLVGWATGALGWGMTLLFCSASVTAAVVIGAVISLKLRYPADWHWRIGI